MRSLRKCEELRDRQMNIYVILKSLTSLAEKGFNEKEKNNAAFVSADFLTFNSSTKSGHYVISQFSFQLCE